MSNITKEILKRLPEDKISDAVFEAANIVLYTKDKNFFLNDEGQVKAIVNEIKKRIELRADPSILMEVEKAKDFILKTIDKEANVSNIIFDTQRSLVTIEAEKPGLAIGKQGSILKEIKEKTLWVPTIKRTPPLRSKLIEDIRAVLYQNSEYRRKFLDQTGHRIYDGWIREKKNEWIRMTYLGSARHVGKSCILLQTPESRILLDCGIDVANEQEPYPFLECPEFNINELDAVIISHAHLDHSGFLPYLFKFGYRKPVYCTAPTRDIMALLQLDFVKIQRGEGQDPIYSSDDIKEMVKHCITLEYEEVTDITPDIRITLYNAGHMLGSSIVHIHIGNGLHNLVYTGDLKFGKSLLLEPAVCEFQRCETLMLESTYGGKDNILPSRAEQDELLKNIIKETIGKGGKVLIPTLGSGRGQEMMLIIEQMVRNKEIPEVPVYVDGLVWDVTAMHTAYPEYLSSTVRKEIFHKDNNPFLSPIFKQVGSAKERQEIIDEAKPCIIIATSGMLNGGPSVIYLKGLAENKKNSLVFSCYQPVGSLGYRIREGEKEVIIKVDNPKNHVTKINMQVHKFEFTQHSDRKQLMSYVHKCKPRPRKIFINHGEVSRCLDLASSIHRTNKIETACPKNLEAVRIK